VLNLAMNAQKFTAAGSVTIRVDAEPAGATSARLRVSVEDTGRGMSPELLARAFDRFEQGDRSTTRTHGGSGLGLAISKQLVERMGGSIDVASIEGKGSVFWFTLELPVAESSLPAAEPNPAGVLPAGGDAKVLIVEDNATNRTVAARLLEKLGYRVEVACDGQEAISLAAAESYGAILMDCQMPSMDGYEATRVIRPGKAAAGKLPSSPSPPTSVSKIAPAATRPA
jgi:CheY-like chemotaxis protein